MTFSTSIKLFLLQTLMLTSVSLTQITTPEFTQPESDGTLPNANQRSNIQLRGTAPTSRELSSTRNSTTAAVSDLEQPTHSRIEFEGSVTASMCGSTCGNVSATPESSTNANSHRVNICEKCFTESTKAPTANPKLRRIRSYLKAAAELWKIGPPLLLVVGTVGNTLSGMVMLRKSLRSTVTGFFLLILAVEDTATLWVGLLRHYLLRVHGINLRGFTDFGCKLHNFLVYWLRHYGSWILVCMTAERFLSVFFPHKAKVLVTRSRCAAAIGVTGLLLFALNAHYFRTFRLAKGCSADPDYLSFHVNIWSWIHYTVVSFVPFVILLFSNVGIIAKITFTNRIKRNQMQQSSAGIKMTSMTAILLLVSFMFLLTSTPISIYIVVTYKVWDSLSDEGKALADLWFPIVVLLAYVNHSCNFFLYCISGPKFRRELVQMFAKLRKQIHPMNETLNSSTKNGIRTSSSIPQS